MPKSGLDLKIAVDYVIYQIVARKEMSFVQNQLESCRKSRWLIWLYVIAVVATVAVTSFIIATLFLIGGGPQVGGEFVVVFLLVSAVTLAIIVIGTCYKFWQIEKGGVAVATMLGGRRIQPNTTDADERKIINVVEEVAIASGVLVPAVYLLENEKGINAFAAGFEINDAVVGITLGAAKLLSRDELQGVIAHEFSHIFHGDMALNMRLLGWLHGITVMALLGYLLCRSIRLARGGSKNQQIVVGAFLVGLTLAVVGYAGMFFASLIKSAVSRQREYLADSSAVQYTRNPSGLAGALKKIASLNEGALIGNVRALETSHFLFADGVKHNLRDLFATHPPLIKRIKKLDPNYRATSGKLSFKQAELAWLAEQFDSNGEAKVEATLSPRQVETKAAWQFRTGEISPLQIASAAALLETIPRKLDLAVHDPYAARAVVCALLLDDRDEIYNKQLEILDYCQDSLFKREVLDLSKEIVKVPASYHLSLVALAVPALALLPQTNYRLFVDVIEKLVEADSNISLFEHLVQVVVKSQLERIRKGGGVRDVRYYSVDAIKGKVVTALACLAFLGNPDNRQVAKEAYNSGLAALKLTEDESQFSVEDLDCLKSCLESCIGMLRQSSVKVREQALAAFLACIGADRQITEQERNLFGVIAVSIDYPILL